MPNNKLIDDAYQSIFKSLGEYSKNISSSYHGGILELAKRLNPKDFSNEMGSSNDFLRLIKEGEGELANWKTDTRMQMIRDIDIVAEQFPELQLAADTALEAMCDGDTTNGGMKLSIVSKNESIDAETLVSKLESKYHIKYHLRNTAFRDTLKHGEYYVLCKKVSDILNYSLSNKKELTESVSLFESVKADMVSAKKSKKQNQNSQQMKLLYEAAEQLLPETNIPHDAVDSILDGITINSSYEQLLYEMYGEEGINLICEDSGILRKTKDNMFENVVDGLSEIPSTENQSKAMDKIKGCYIKWLSATQVLPIKVGTILVGYYYIHYANTNISNKTSFAGGVVDLSQTTTLASSKDFMTQLAHLVVSNMDQKFIQRNIDMVDDITAILMENQFRKKDVSFTFIPKEDIIPFKINIDVEGNGTSMFSRSLFNARLYTMLMMSNIITILNNRPSRTYKVKRDPRTNNIASTIQRFKEKIYSKRIGVDDVWSYNGAMNKIGAPTDMVIPVDQDGTPPFTKEYDEGANIPLNTELMEMTKKTAITLSGVPNAIINQQDEIEYSKLAQMAQLKLLDFVKGLKIDLNASTTEFYRRLIQLEFGLSEEVVSAITVSIPDVRSNDITIISEMLQTFSTIFDQLQTVLITPEQAQTPDGKPSNAVKNLKYELMKIMVPSLDYAEMEKIVRKVMIDTVSDDLNDQQASFTDFSDEDIMADAGGAQQ